LARLKYTIDKHGIDWFKEELEQRIDFKLQEARPYHFTERKDYYGWQQNHEGLWYYTAFVENGRVGDFGNVRLKSALLEIAKTSQANFRFTCSQNVMVADVLDSNKSHIERILLDHGVISLDDSTSPLRKNSMACVALSTCPLALAEGQRYLPSLISKIEPLMQKYRLASEEIVLRMTGCPNGCARPYVAEIGFVGTSLGKYNLHIGGDRQGTRLNKLFKENLDEPAILRELEQLLSDYNTERRNQETFGDFSNRKYFN
jgi:sulfite reductase (NADPH) hemoprotein beta-component